MYYIVAKYRGKVETIDKAEDLRTALYLRGEYQLAYGRQWEVWISETEDGPPSSL
jgi:hypothetical protein